MRFAALVLAFALLGATENAPRDPGGDLAYVEMIVNSQERVEVFAAITDQDLLVQKSDLVAAHIAVATGKEQHLAGFDFVSLQSLARRKRHCCRYRPTILERIPKRRYSIFKPLGRS